ncbi:hypothetical protein B0H14DRAFT_3046964, partial [Mycena olivaceomarginata]
MRPVYPLSPKRKIPEHIQLPDHAIRRTPKSTRRPEGNPRYIKRRGHREKMRPSAGCRVKSDLAAAAIRPGITTDEIDEIVHKRDHRKERISLGLELPQIPEIRVHVSPLPDICFWVG